jgi:hypothetical protein
MLFEVSATDRLIFSTVARLSLCVALVASVIPALRAMRVGPRQGAEGRVKPRAFEQEATGENRGRIGIPAREAHP